MSELDKQIFENIDKLLRKKGCQQKDLTDYLGLNRNAYSNWKKAYSEDDNKCPYRKHLIEIARFFDVSIDFLVYGKTSGFTENEMNILSLFRHLTEEEQLWHIGITKGMIESKKTKENKTEENNIEEKKIAARKIARRTDGEAVRTDVTEEEIAVMEQLPEETDF